MVQNIAIIGLDRSMTYDVAKMLAGELDMYFFDALELFEFDNLPRSFAQVLKEQGIGYYREKEKSIIGYSAGFTNCVINLEGGVAEQTSNFAKIKQNSLLVYLDEDADVIKKSLTQKKYKTEEEKRFFDVDFETLKQRALVLAKNADIIVNVEKNSNLKIASEIIRSIKNYYAQL